MSFSFLPWIYWLSFIFILFFLECQNYQSLSNADRKVSSGNQYLCDNGLATGWYRFQGAAGTRMPTSCTPERKCGTDATGWLRGGHPAVADGRVTRQVCFSWFSNCCLYSDSRWSKYIQVRNCGSFFVYYLSSTPECKLRYCGTD